MFCAVGHWGQGKIWRFTNNILAAQTYFCEADVPGGGILIDAGLDYEALDQELSKIQRFPSHIFCTHGHFDHIGGAAYFQKKYGTKVFLHLADKKEVARANFLLMAFKMPHRIELPEIDYIQDSFSFDLGNQSLSFRWVPGHTQGSCLIKLGNVWFTGDTLYGYGIGLSRLPGEDQQLLKANISNLWNELTNVDMIFPGHGEPASGHQVVHENLPLLDFLGKTGKDQAEHVTE